MKRYIEHLKSKPAHQRRQHATKIAGVITAFVFMVWFGTLGMRLVSSSASITEQDMGGSTQLANIVSGAYAPGVHTFEVATTTAQ